jgi:hypothetical protein
MPTEWERRALDEPTQQTVPQVPLKSAQTVDVDGTVIYPDELHQWRSTENLQATE